MTISDPATRCIVRSIIPVVFRTCGAACKDVFIDPERENIVVVEDDEVLVEGNEEDDVLDEAVSFPLLIKVGLYPKIFGRIGISSQHRALTSSASRGLAHVWSTESGIATK